MAILTSYSPGDVVTGFTRASTATYLYAVPVDLDGAGGGVVAGGTVGVLSLPVVLEGTTGGATASGTSGEFLPDLDVVNVRRPGGSFFTIAPRTFRLARALGERSECSFKVYDDGASLDFEYREPIEVLDRDGDLVFKGPVVNSESTYLAPGMVEHMVTLTSWHMLFDDRTVAGGWEDMLAGDIVRDILSTYMEEDGVLISNATIENGPMIDRAVSNYKPASTLLEEIAERTGYWWDIDDEKGFVFVDRASITAPWNATIDDMKKVRYRKSSPKFRTVQYITGGVDLTAGLPPAEFSGDGKRQTFTVGFPVAKVPTVNVDGVEKTVGIRGLDSGKDWYWSKGSNEITQDDSAAALTSAETLTVDYVGQYPATAKQSDPTAIDMISAIDGTSGKVEAAEDATEAEGREEMMSRASAKLARYAKLGGQLDWSTARRGLKPGHLQTTTVDEFGLSEEQLLVERVNTRATETALFDSIRSIKGPKVGTWPGLFKKIARQGRRNVDNINIGQVDVVVLTKEIVEDWIWSESVTVDRRSCPVPSDDTYPSESLYPC